MKFAVFDLDGTLVKVSAASDFVEWLSRKGKFPERNLENILAARENHRKGKISYFKRVELIVFNWAQGFKGKNYSEVMDYAEEFAEEYNGFFDSSLELLKFFKERNYFLIVVSGAFEEIIKVLNPFFNFDFIVGTKFEVKNGVYTGNVLNEMWKKEIKGKILAKLIKEKNLDLRDSFGFGDSEQDFFMMKLTENPICIKPTNGLKKIAERRRWQTFNEIKEAMAFLKKRKQL
jgi:HAD superfamily hydrolase (TIGR01490 family)